MFCSCASRGRRRSRHGADSGPSTSVAYSAVSSIRRTGAPGTSESESAARRAASTISARVSQKSRPSRRSLHGREQGENRTHRVGVALDRDRIEVALDHETVEAARIAHDHCRGLFGCALRESRRPATDAISSPMRNSIRAPSPAGRERDAQRASEPTRLEIVERRGRAERARTPVREDVEHVIGAPCRTR